MVEANEGQGVLADFMGGGFYHLSFLVEGIEEAAVHLEHAQRSILPSFGIEAFDGNLWQFFVSRLGHLIELAEMSEQDFAAFFAARTVSSGTDPWET